MQPAQVEAVQTSWALLAPVSDQAAELFYTNLFAHDPSIRALFEGDMHTQGKRLMTMIGMAVENLNNPRQLVPTLRSLSKRHISYGVTDAHYHTMGKALQQTLAQGLGTAYTPEVNEAWSRVYGTLREVMVLAANDDA